MKINTYDKFITENEDSSQWTEEERKKLSEAYFSPFWDREDDYRKEISYADYVYDTVYKNSSNSYSGTKHIYVPGEDRYDHTWEPETEEFTNFDELISWFEY